MESSGTPHFTKDHDSAHEFFGSQYAITLRLRLQDVPGTLARVTAAIASANGSLGAIDLITVDAGYKTRDFTVYLKDEHMIECMVDAVKKVEGAELLHVSDRVFDMHLGGKIHMGNKMRIHDRATLSLAYTPGVARVCCAIEANKSLVYRYTIKSHVVAIVTDGTAVLGLGDIGPEAALPVMEGKAMLFKEFGGIDAWPICLATKNVDEIVATVKAIAPGFGGINLEDISAPRCFEVEDRLKAELDIPVFHDDQHGTAVVVLAALINALKIVGKKMEDLRIVVSGAGAAGVSVCKILMSAGVKDVIVCDRSGAIYKGRAEHMNKPKEWLAENTNPRCVRGAIGEALRGADVFVGVSTPGAVTVEQLRGMAEKPIVFALANPTPEVPPEQLEGFAAVVASGRSDYPNQINNVMCFPGLFKGALQCQATDINEEMKLAAARAIAAILKEEELSPEYVVPSVFDKRVAKAVAEAVEKAAVATGVAHAVSNPGKRLKTE